ncbi:MAG: sensor histidine kinase [Ruthenibacterium sp.]
MKKLIRSLVQHYTLDMHLYTKLLISHMTLIVIPIFVLTVFLYGSLYDALVTDTISSEQALTEQTASTVEATLARVVSTANSMQDSIKKAGLFRVGNTPQERQLRTFTESVQSLADGQVVTDVRVYVADIFSDYFKNATADALIQPLSGVQSTYWYGIISSGNSALSKGFWCPSLYLSPNEIAHSGELAYIACLPYANGGEPNICVAVYFSQKSIDGILQQNLSVANSAAYIINQRDALVSTSSTALSGAYSMSNRYLEDTVGSLNRYVMGTYLGEDIYIGYYDVADTDWRIVSILPADNLIRKGTLLVAEYAGFYLVFSLLALALALALSHSITKRITAVVQQMKTVETGTPVPLPQAVAAHDEIGVLTDTYNSMANEINSLLDTQAQTSKALQLSEFKALQAQINPHFLYNSLDMINWLSLAGESQKVTQAIHALSRFYKLTLSKKDTLGTVDKELEHVSLYVQLQNMRFENRIHFLVDVPDELLYHQIPKLIFQPIVENSILHGILEKPEKEGSITLTAWRENDDIVFYVIDDGMGMTETVSDKILRGEDTGAGQNNIGIYNTHCRLQLFYGPGYGLHYKSEPGKGTETEIRIPARELPYSNLTK